MCAGKRLPETTAPAGLWVTAGPWVTAGREEPEPKEGQCHIREETRADTEGREEGPGHPGPLEGAQTGP